MRWVKLMGMCQWFLGVGFMKYGRTCKMQRKQRMRVVMVTLGNSGNGVRNKYAITVDCKKFKSFACM